MTYLHTYISVPNFVRYGVNSFSFKVTVNRILRNKVFKNKGTRTVHLNFFKEEQYVPWFHVSTFVPLLPNLHTLGTSCASVLCRPGLFDLFQKLAQLAQISTNSTGLRKSSLHHVPKVCKLAQIAQISTNRSRGYKFAPNTF